MAKMKKWNCEGFFVILIAGGLTLVSNKSIHNITDWLCGVGIIVLPIALIFAIMTKKD